ncbi:MAG: hypothetical protein RLT05_10995 [Bauldia litoralis]
MKRRSAVATLVTALALVLVGGAARAASIDPFIGTYVGTAVVESDEKITKRDLNIVISKKDEGFEIDWTTVIPKEDKTVRRQFKIRFLPTPRPDVFKAAMRMNAFGAAVPLDPLKGDPYVWASIRGKSLFVYGILVTDKGGYELQVYQRTLKPGGMTVRFQRIHDGKKHKDITGEVKKVK